MFALEYHLASIDGAPAGFGVGTTARSARARARGEALETRALSTPALARPGATATRDSVERWEGLYAAYMRSAAPLTVRPGAAGASLLVKPLHSGAPWRCMPGAWAYLAGSAATNSNGVAFAATLGAARRAAMFELIERDTLLRAWYGLVRSRPLSRTERALPALAGHGVRVQREGLSVRWFVLGTGRPVTVACVIYGTRSPQLGLGSATRDSLDLAATKAFLEAAGSCVGHAAAFDALGPRRFSRFVAGLRERSAERLHRRHFEALWATTPAESAAIIAARFSRSRLDSSPRLRTDGYHWIDMTPRDMDRGRVVKVIHPDAAPLPNTLAQVRLLERLLRVRGDGNPPPIA